MDKKEKKSRSNPTKILELFTQYLFTPKTQPILQDEDKYHPDPVEPWKITIHPKIRNYFLKIF